MGCTLAQSGEHDGTLHRGTVRVRRASAMRPFCPITLTTRNNVGDEAFQRKPPARLASVRLGIDDAVGQQEDERSDRIRGVNGADLSDIKQSINDTRRQPREQRARLPPTVRRHDIQMQMTGAVSKHASQTLCPIKNAADQQIFVLPSSVVDTSRPHLSIGFFTAGHYCKSAQFKTICRDDSG